MLLSEAIEALLLSTLADGRSDRTLKFYRDELAHLFVFLGDVPVEGVTVDHLRRYIADQMGERTLYAGRSTRKPQRGKLSPFTIQTRVRAVKRLFNWLEQEGHINVNPARRIKTPHPKRQEPKGISWADFLALVATTEAGGLDDLRDKAIAMFLLDTGVRVGGLCGLRVGDLDIDAGLAVVTEKGDKSRYAMFTEPTGEALRDWLKVRPGDRGPWVFVGLHPKSIGALTPNGVAQMLRRRARRAGCKGPTNPHAFRHGFARYYILHGGDLGTLADILGHSDVGVTKAYYGVFTVRELQEVHRQHSPIAGLFGGNEDGS